MLTRRLLVLCLACIAAATVLLPAHTSPALADPVQICHPVGQDWQCEVVNLGHPPGGGGGGGGGGSGVCTWQGNTYPCWQDGWGWFNETDGCYYALEKPPPPAGDPAWAGHAPNDGAVWRQRCFGDITGFLVWRATPPPGQGGGITPAQLAARAIASMKLRGVDIASAPAAGGSGLVGLPVWLWTTATPETWGPISITAAVPGLAVTATARVSKFSIAMGDGHTVSCTVAGVVVDGTPSAAASPGTPYLQSYGNTASPTCGYRYTQPSRTQPGGKYTVVATTSWQITWSVVGGGASGSDSAVRTSTTFLKIDELQVIVS